MKKAYYNLARQLHPDKNLDDRGGAAVRFRKVKDTYDFLMELCAGADDDDGVSFSSVPCQASTVPFPMTSPFWAGRHPLLFLSQIHSR